MPARTERPARRKARPARKRIGVALAGGGPLGAIYEIGALCALQEAIDGLDFCDCDSYIGVSAGGFIAAGLINGLSPRRLCAAFIENSLEPPESFDPTVLLRPAWDEYRRRLALLPGLLAAACWDTVVNGRSITGAFERVGRALPTGLLSGDSLAAKLHEQFTLPGRTDDFRELKRRLVLVATDLDGGEAIPFGMPGWDHVPISRAVQASAALPGLFPPVEIDGRHYVDGALKKTIHASVLLQEGLDLLICLNPLVPYEAESGTRADGAGTERPKGKPGSRPIPRLVDGGLPVVLSQTLRSLIHSRLELGMKGYGRSHPNTDIVLFEPDHRDAELFLANTFSYSQRRRMAEHAYQSTRAKLLAQSPALSATLAKHGLQLRMDVLLDSERRLLAAELPGEGRTARALARLDLTLRALEARYRHG
ncbi:patatin-like phospholipase family protein [Paucibacter sp. APW11]|uniref:Patatin-like phospholipase family protein n=1 Tax=Roseateles aquae TaxID=3077235 RepID=A0ABU3PCN9_9BURK|nr:patatin-like phospholipase family protein [Paucibacter sp. APW11]MDT9000303.1 patatin-like phospholipase family protein [Paucibacter sp. APW11]